MFSNKIWISFILIFISAPVIAGWLPLTVSEYYVDSVNGLDTNNGLSPATAFQNLTALPSAIPANTVINLAAGSHWRQELNTISGHPANVTVQGYGVGAGSFPIIDGSDILPNANFVKTGGYTNVYNTSAAIVFPQKDVSYGQYWANLFETGGPGDSATGTFLAYVTTEALVDSTACSYTIPGMTTGGSGAMPASATIYIHSCDSTNPVSNGYTYEVGQRAPLVMYGLNNAVQNIEVRKGGNRSGEFLLLGDGQSYALNNVIGRDGVSNIVQISGGSTITNSQFIDQYFYSSGNFVIFYDNVGSGLNCVANNNIFQQDQNTVNNAHTGSGITIIISSTTSGSLGSITTNFNWFIALNGSTVNVGDMGGTTAWNSFGNNFSNMVRGFQPLASQTVASTNDWWISATSANSFVTFIASGSAFVANNDNVCSSNQTTSMIYTGGKNTESITLNNSKFYQLSPNTNSIVIYSNSADTGSSFTFNGNDFGSNKSGWLPLYDTGSSNTFAGGATTATANIYEAVSFVPTFTLNNSSGKTFAQWKTLVSPQDSNSTTSGGNAVSACTFPSGIPSVQ